MKLSHLFDVPRPFASHDELCRAVKSQEFERAHREGKAFWLLIYDTDKQRTWISCDKSRLYCILDWTREERPRLRWYIDRKNLISEDGKILIVISAQLENARFGKVRLNGKKPRNYSAHLFPNGDVVERIGELIKSMK